MDEKPDSREPDARRGDRLEELKTEMFGHFGKITRWRGLCREQEARTEAHQIRLAEEVLASPSTGAVTEWWGHHLRLKGSNTFKVNEHLDGEASRDSS